MRFWMYKGRHDHTILDSILDPLRVHYLENVDVIVDVLKASLTRSFGYAFWNLLPTNMYMHRNSSFEHI